MQIVAVVGGSEKLATPTFGTVTSTAGGFTFSITNYSASNGYTVSTTAGSASQTGGTVTQSGLGYSASATVSVYATRAGYETSDTATQAGTSSACVPAGCTPPCGSAILYTSVTCGGSVISCGGPGCTSGCVRWVRDYYRYDPQTCYDNCGVPTTATCASFDVDSTVASSCC